MSALRTRSGVADRPQSNAVADQGALGTVRLISAGNPNQTFFDLNLRRAWQMHRALAITIIVLSVLGATAYLVRSWNRYTAASTIYVKPAQRPLLENGPSQSWPYDANTYESYIQQQIQGVTRPDVLAAALRKVPGWQRPSEDVQKASERLTRALEVNRVGASYKISIKAKGRSAAEAAQLANAVATSFVDSATRELRAGDTQRIELLREERDRIQKEMTADRAEQEELNKKLGIAAVAGNLPDPYDEQISAVRGELVKARAANDEAAARLTALANSGASNAALDAEADEIVSADPGMVSMKTALNKRRSDLISQMANLTASNPLFKQDEEELAKINASLESMSKDLRAKAAGHIQQRLRNDLERTSQLENRLNTQLAQLTGAAGSATPRLQRSNELATDILRLQNRFAIVDEQYRNLTLENNAPGSVYLSDPALVPLEADRGRVFRNCVIVLVLGLVLALGAALLAHNLDSRIYVAADVERILGFAPMALLPDFYEVGTGVSEEYMLRLAAAVEHAYQEGALKSCIFTGVAPGVGATTVANRVTSMLEAMGRDTVLVDASGTPPPTPSLESGSPENTDLVPSPRGSRSTALLQRMTEGGSDDSIVLSDTAPLLVSGETEYLARFTDSAIVVIESGVTTRTQLREVAHTLQRLEVRAAGFVLNRISMENADVSFRNSVRAVESHLLAQTRSFVRKNGKKRASRKSESNAVGETAPDEPAGVQAAEPPRPVQQKELEANTRTVTPAKTAEPVRHETVRHTQTSEPAKAAGTSHRIITPEPITEKVLPPSRTSVPVAPSPKAREARVVDAPVVRESAVTAQPQSASIPETAAIQAEGPGIWMETATPVARVLRGREAERTSHPELTRPVVEPPSPPQSKVAERSIPPEPAAAEPRPAPAATSGTVVSQAITRIAQTIWSTSSGESSAPAEPIVSRVVPNAEESIAPRRTEATKPAAPASVESPRPAASRVPEAVIPRATAKPYAPPATPVAPATAWRPTDPIPPAAARAAAFPVWTPTPPISAPPPTSHAARPEKPAPLRTVVEPPVAAIPPVNAAGAAPKANTLPADPELEPEDFDDLPYSAASRLGGLRNLLVSLGLKTLGKDAENAGQDTPEDPYEHMSARPVYAEPDIPSAQDPAEVTGPAGTVMAQPEFIPPRPVAERVEREMEPVRPTPKRVARWDSPEDIETLPSWRGQYRRRR